MNIRQIIVYITAGAPARRQVGHGHGGSIDKIPPGLSGRFTHTSGYGGTPELTPPVFVADEETPTYKATLRLVTDGDLDAYTSFGGGFHQDDLEWEAKKFKADIAPMLIDVDAFDREYIWQRLWYTQHRE